MTWFAVVPLLAFWVFLAVQFRKPYANRVVRELTPLERALRDMTAAMLNMQRVIGLALLPVVHHVVEQTRAYERAFAAANDAIRYRVQIRDE